MKIKNYKLVYDSDHNDYNVYTDEIKSRRDDSDGFNLGCVYQKWRESCWHLIPCDITDISSDGPYPYCHNKWIKPAKTRKKAAKKLVKYQNKILREMKE